MLKAKQESRWACESWGDKRGGLGTPTQDSAVGLRPSTLQSAQVRLGRERDQDGAWGFCSEGPGGIRS